MRSGGWASSVLSAGFSFTGLNNGSGHRTEIIGGTPDVFDWRNDLESYTRVGNGNRNREAAGYAFTSINIHWSWQYWYVGAGSCLPLTTQKHFYKLNTPLAER